jgi:pimeloyl-ACP methyl ester carboxylesterase
MKPVLLLIPGMLNTAAIWDDVRAALGDAVDARVADVSTQTTIDAMARDAAALLGDTAGRRVVACGFSMGGYVLQEMLAQGFAPDALVFLSTSPRPESDEGRVVRAKTIAAIERDFEKVVQNLATFVIDPSRHDDAAFVERVRELTRAAGADAAIRQNQAVTTRRDHRALLRQCAMPARVICGRADRTTPPECSEELASLLPHARLEWLDHTAHMSPLEAAPRVAALIHELL